MAEYEQPLAATDGIRYSGKLWSGSPIAQDPLSLLAELATELSTARDFEALQRVLSRNLRWILDFDRCTLAVRSEYLDNATGNGFSIGIRGKEDLLFHANPTIGAERTPATSSVFSQLAPEYLLFEITSPSRAKNIPPQKIPIDEGWPGRVILSSKPDFIEDLSQLPLSVTSPSKAHWGIDSKARSLMLLPLRIREHTVGSLNFSSNTLGVYSITWRNIASLLASQVGGQLESVVTQMQLKSAYEFHKRVMVSATAQDITVSKRAESVLLRAKVAEAANLTLEHQMQERTLQLQQALEFESRLKRITDKVRDSLDESQIVQTAVMELTLGLNVGCCNMAFYNLDQGTSTICYEYATSIPASQGRVAQMIDFSELYRQLLQNQYFQFCSIMPNPFRGRVAMLACPIFDDQEVLGDLWLINQQNHGFNELEIRLVQQVANQCAIAIRQARLYQAATAQVEELEKLNALKDDFLSTVSHELRTPVSNMRMAIQMIKIAPTLERRERYLEILHTECEREISLINALLDLQQLEDASYAISPEVVRLQDWLPGIIEPFRLRTQEQQQLLQVELPPFLHPIISNSTSLGRILAELLNNACKYTPKEGKITLSVRQDLAIGIPSSSISFKVCNEAEIAVTELPHIFEKFYRIPSADPWKQGGTGLGLALVQKLVNKLEGTIEVESSRGWTTFNVEVAAPVAPTEH